MNDVSQRLARLSPEKLQLLERRLGQGDVAESIAIVGMSCRLPGAPNLDAYWRVISEGIHAVAEVPKDRWDLDELYDPTGEQAGKMSVRHIGSIKDVNQFDAPFFGISPREAARMDPQQRLLLEVAWEALEVGGLSPEAMSGQATGVFVGIGAADYAKVFMHYANYYGCIDAHVGTGNALSIAANRVSYVLDLRGPSMAVDTACSSSTVAIHTAIQSLRNRECNAAIAGGVNLILTPETTIAFSKAHMLSTDGHCRPFDSGANGYVRGEGCGLLVLKRLTDATRDRDNILGIIRASAVNQDGRTSGITAPNARSQQAVIRAALAQARWMPDRVEYIEAHGTGTPLGDPIEMESLTRIFRRNHADDVPCYVSSVKANIGHTETVSGVAGIIKVLLMMQHGQIPAQLHFQQLNTHISLEGTRLEIPSANLDWHRNSTPRTAGVSSFGFGGTNTHILLEESVATPAPAVKRDRTQHLLVLSAKTETALDAIVQNYGKFLSDHPTASLADVCATANAGRSHFNHRIAVNAAHTAEMREKLAQLSQGKKQTGTWRRQTKAAASPKVAFVFTGQGSQYLQMGRELYETQPTFRRTLEQCDAILRPLLEQSLPSVLFPDDGEPSSLDETAYTQPALFAIEYSLAKLWMSWGIEPALVLGHSVGEYVAACIAGVFSLEHGLQLIAERARLMQQLPQDGMMAVVFAPSTRVEAALADCSDRAAIAALNGPDNTVISGDKDTVRDLLDAFALEGIRTQALTVSHAFHSPLMDPMLDEFEAFAATLDFAAPKIPLVSNLTGAVMTATPGPGYWRRHVRSPVRFAEGIELLKSQEITAVLEIGPTSSLLGMARRCLPEFKASWLPSLRKGQSDWSSMLASLAELYVLGTKISWSGFDADWPRRRLILPTYPFERSRHWLDPTTPERSLTSGSSGPSLHPLLGHHVPTALDTELYENRISSHWPSYLADHQVQGSPVLPAAAYVEQALGAAAQTFGPGNHRLLDVEFQQAMFLPQRMSRTVQLSVAPEQSGARPFETFSVAADAETSTKWTLHAAGRIEHANVANDGRPQPIDLDAIRRRTTDCTTQQHFYDEMRKRTLDYGPSFQMLDNLARADCEAVADVRLPESVARELSQYHIHPVLGDALFQSMAGLVPREADGSLSTYTYMPVAVRVVRFFAPLAEKMFVHAVRTSKGDQAIPEIVEGDVSLLDEQGQVILQFLGVRVQRVARAAQGSTSVDVRDWLYRVSWRPASLEKKAVTRSRWLIFCDDSGVGAELAEQTRRHGGEALLVRPGETFGKLPVHNGDVPGYVIDPSNEDHYRSLLEHTIGSSSTETIIAHLWSLDLDDPSDFPERSLAASRVLGCHSVLHLVQQLARRNNGRPPRLALITRGAQAIDDGDAEIAVGQSPLWGLGRVVAMEHRELRSRLVDLDPAQDAMSMAAQLMQEFAADDHEEQIVYRNQQRLVARLEPTPEAIRSADQPNNSSGETSVPTDRPFRLRFSKAGSFDTLRYEPMQRGTPADGQVELAVHAAGINFSDILKVMGLYPGITDPVVPLGIEAAGIVTAIGPGVTRFRIGDEVLGVVPFSLASHARTAEYALVPMPQNINYRQAATIPITFLTAHYALCKLAQLERGERVLIHAAAGGVGLAAIQIAQHVGAEVFATAGSEEKRDVLRRLGVKHVFSSRSLDFAEQIMEVTGREGVDVVLNSLPGEAIASSLGILRAYGRFLEIGKTDIYQNRKIGLSPFQDNLSYFAIDLDRLLRQRPATVTSLFTEVMQLFESGVYRPLPLTEFPARNVAGAFRYMAQRKNIGKVVVSIDAVTNDESVATSPSQKVESVGTYLITGGFGALGLQVAQRLATNGVRHLALLSRSEVSDEIKSKLSPLVAAGVKVVTLQGDVADATSLRAALEKIPSDFPPLRGVYHAAGVLDDGVLFDMTAERFNRVLAPKVNGAWNLHAATRDMPLDTFVLFSSVACVLGSPGQGNYAAGNAFLDSLATYRRQRGMPVTSVNWGPWAGAGMASRSNLNESPKARGIAPIDPTQALDILDRLIEGSSDVASANVTVADVRWSELLRMMPGRRPSLLADMTADDGLSAAKEQQSSLDVVFRRQLADADIEERQTMLRECLAGELARIMGIESANLDLEQPLNALGLDSLMAMELKAVVESRLGFSLPMARFFENPSVASLAADAAKLIAADGTNAQSENASSSNIGQGADVSRSSWSPVVPLETRGALPPLFLLHPFGGDVRCYFELSRHFGGERPIYALTARGLGTSLPPHESMDAMLADYASAISDVCPSGPYNLAGWSTGGIYAYALAQRLLQAGERVGLLAMLDTPMPSLLDDTDFEDPARFMCQYVDFCNRLLGAKMHVSYEQLKSLTVDEMFEVALAEARRHEMVPADASVEFLRRFVQVGQYNARIIKHYTPTVLDIPLHLFMPAQSEALAELTGKTFAADHGWGSKLGCQVTLHRTPGDHFSMLTGDDASDLAESLTECLRAADGDDTSRTTPTLAAR